MPVPDLSVEMRDEMTSTKRIGIAVVEYHCRYLVGERGPDGVLAGFAEFPGGKCLDEESPIDCAIRECFEESGLVVVPERLLQRREFEYPHGRLELFFVLCHPTREITPDERYGNFYWETVEGLRRLKFPEGNSDILNLLG